MQDCLENKIIGITKTQCPCFSAEFTADASVSNSGLYMDQLEESLSLEAYRTNKDCGATLEQVMDQARTNAIADFKRALYEELGTRYSVRQQMYAGAIGQVMGNGYLNLAYPFAGEALEMQPTRGATIQVTGIQPLFNFDGTLEVKVYKAVSSGSYYLIQEEVATLTLDALIVNPTAQAPASPLILDATDESGKALTYLFVYDRTDGFQPKNNTTSCGCGNKESILHQYLRPSGILGTDINNFQLSNRTDKINGLLIYVEARCGTGGFICENYMQNEFIRESVNWAVLYRSVSNSIIGVLNSILINRYSMANREQMSFNVKVLGGKFRKSVAWLAEHMDLSRNDCYFCSPGITGTVYDYQKDGILL